MWPLGVELVAALTFQHNFSTIFYYGPNATGCSIEEFLSQPSYSVPVVNWRSNETIPLLSFVNEELLVLACLRVLQWQNALRELAKNLNYIRQAKILIEMADTSDKELVNAILKVCQYHDLLNTVLIFTDFTETRIVYSYDTYPNFMLNHQQFVSDASWLYPNKMLDLKGYGLRTLPDLSEPNTILYHDAEGHPRLLGYVWNMLKEYARKRNASLFLIAEPVEGKTLSHIQVMDLARDRSVDVAASVQPMTLRYHDRSRQYAYPVHCSSWCTMIPMEQAIETRDIYAWTVPVQTMAFLGLICLIYTLLHRRWLRHRRLQGIAWLGLASLLSINFEGRMLGLFVTPPLEPPINSFQAMANSKARIFGLRSEYNSYDFDMRTKFASIFRLSNQPAELIRLRNSLNTSYAYTVTYTKFQLYAEQQAHSSRPLFRYSTDLCYYQMSPFALVIPENSPHRAPLHNYMLELGESGLFEYWVSRSFYYMVMAGRLHMEDLFSERQALAISVDDLSYIFHCYLLGMSAGIVLLLIEKSVHWAKANKVL